MVVAAHHADDGHRSGVEVGRAGLRRRGGFTGVGQRLLRQRLLFLDGLDRGEQGFVLVVEAGDVALQHDVPAHQQHDGDDRQRGRHRREAGRTPGRGQRGQTPHRGCARGDAGGAGQGKRRPGGGEAGFDLAQDAALEHVARVARGRAEADALGDRAQRRDLRLAVVAARVEVGPDERGLVGVEGVEGVGLEQLGGEVVQVAGGEGGGHASAPTSGRRSGAGSGGSSTPTRPSRATRILRMPNRMRVFTVPSGVASRSAIWAWVSPL